MTKQFKLKGTGVAIVTPFHNYGTIDFGNLEKLIAHIIDGGVDFIVAQGTTSEAATLTSDEKNAVSNFILETIDGRVPLVLGIGGNSTQTVVSQVKKTDFTGIDAILSVAPYYNKPNQKGLYHHFKSVAGASPVPVILYNVPGRTASNLTAETTIRLANDFENIVAIKEASGNFLQVMKILSERPEGFRVFSGDDALTFPSMALGADGVISVVANAFPNDFSTMVSLMNEGKYDHARKIHYALLPIINMLFADGNPAGIKAALEIKGIVKNNLRLPMVKANRSVYLALEKLIQDYQPPLG
jgi:4-hydroxy-tetrahydrodipicolinate synthase